MPERSKSFVLQNLATFLRVAVRPCLLLCSTAFSVSGTLASPAEKTIQPFPKQTQHLRPADKPPHHNTLKDVSIGLRNVKSVQEARALERQAETLRQGKLSPGVRLMLEHADAALTSHNYRKAESILDNSLVLQPDEAFIRRARARIRYAAGDFEGAISDLGTALHQDPNDPLCWQLLSQVEEERHDVHAALKAARQLLVVDPYAAGAVKRAKTLQTSLDGSPI